jgi:hypothetical protein
MEQAYLEDFDQCGADWDPDYCLTGSFRCYTAAYRGEGFDPLADVFVAVNKTSPVQVLSGAGAGFFD